MAQLFAQQDRQPDTWVMSGAPTATVVYLSLQTTINYSSGSPDTLPADTPAVIYGTSNTAFDRSLDVWIPFTVRASGVLSIIKESQLATITADYVAMARVELHSIKPYQPEPYLASGGLGGGVSTTSVVLLSSPAARALTLWNGSSMNAPPTSWQTSGFDDSAWPHAVDASTGTQPPDGSQWIWPEKPSLVGHEEALFRHHFTLPPGVPQAATFTLFAQNITGAYLNGTSVGAGTTGGTLDVLALLNRTGDNVLAVWVYDLNAVAGFAGLYYDLALTFAAGGSLLSVSSPAEGDLAYFHGGTWQRLPVGTSGQELTVVSGDPAWATPAAGSVTSVALAGPTGTTVSGSPVTSSGTLSLSWASQSANVVLAAPNGSSGAPTFRALVGADIPVDASTIISSAGVIKGNYQAGSGVSISGNTITATGSGGSVTSVALSLPGIFSVSGSPITTSGTLSVTLATQNAATVFAGPASGSAAAPTFRALQPADLPAAAAAGGHIHAHGHFL